MFALAGIAAEEPVAAALLVVASGHFVIAARVAPAVAAGADIHAFVTAALFALAAGAVTGAFVAVRTWSLAVVRIAALVVVAVAVDATEAAWAFRAIAVVAACGAIGVFFTVSAALLARWTFRNDGTQMVEAGEARAEGRTSRCAVTNTAALTAFVPDTVAADAASLGDTGAAFARGAVATCIDADATGADVARALAM
jgi:hypothetical protein